MFLPPYPCSTEEKEAVFQEYIPDEQAAVLKSVCRVAEVKVSECL